MRKTLFILIVGILLIPLVSADYFNTSCQQRLTQQIIHNQNYTYNTFEINISLDTTGYGWTNNPQMFVVRNDTNQILNYYNFTSFNNKNTELWTNTSLDYNDTFEIEIYYGCKGGQSPSRLKDVFVWAIDGEDSTDLSDVNYVNTSNGNYHYNTSYKWRGSNSIQSNTSINIFSNLNNISEDGSYNTNLSNFISTVRFYNTNQTTSLYSSHFMSSLSLLRYIGGGLSKPTVEDNYFIQGYNYSGTDMIPLELNAQIGWFTVELGLNNTDWSIKVDNTTQSYMKTFSYSSPYFSDYPKTVKNLYIRLYDGISIFDDWYIRSDRGNQNPTRISNFESGFSNHSPNILNNYTTPNPLMAGVNNYLSVNISDPRNNRITSVYFNLTAPNQTIVIGSTNASTFNAETWHTSTEWNSTTYVIPNSTGSLGVWSYEILINNNVSDYYYTRSNFTVSDIWAPILVNITNPENNTLVAQSDVLLNFTYLDDYGAYNCWATVDNVNQTPVTCENFTVNSLTLTNHKVTITVNDTGGNMKVSPYTNFTVIADNSDPNIIVTSPTNGQTLNVRHIYVTGSISDNVGLSNCTYNVYRGASLEVANTSFGCGSGALFDFYVSGDADYKMYIYAYDPSNNGNLLNVNFTTTSGFSTGDTLGGGGSPSEVIQELTFVTFEVTPNFLDRYTYIKSFDNQVYYEYTLKSSIDKLSYCSVDSDKELCNIDGSNVNVKIPVDIENGLWVTKQGEIQVASNDGQVVRNTYRIQALNLGYYYEYEPSLITKEDITSNTLFFNTYEIDNQLYNDGVRLWWISLILLITAISIYIHEKN